MPGGNGICRHPAGAGFAANWWGRVVPLLPVGEIRSQSPPTCPPTEAVSAAGRNARHCLPNAGQNRLTLSQRRRRLSCRIRNPHAGSATDWRQYVGSGMDSFAVGSGLNDLWRIPFPWCIYVRRNSRRAFAVVRAAKSSGDRPRTAARHSAVSFTNAGSLRLPRCGEGAR